MTLHDRWAGGWGQGRRGSSKLQGEGVTEIFPLLPVTFSQRMHTSKRTTYLHLLYVKDTPRNSSFANCIIPRNSFQGPWILSTLSPKKLFPKWAYRPCRLSLIHSWTPRAQHSKEAFHTRYSLLPQRPGGFGVPCSFRSLPASDLLLLSPPLQASFQMQLRNLRSGVNPLLGFL